MFITFLINHNPATQITFQQLLQGYVPNTAIEPPSRNTRTLQTENPNFSDEQKQNIHIAKTYIHKLDDTYATVDMNAHYTSFRIPKHSGGFRQIDEPDPNLKAALSTTKAMLEQAGLLSHNAAYAYVKSRCAKNAIEKHQKRNHKWYLKLDLHNFFGSCSFDFIIRQLNQIAIFAALGDDTIEKLTHVAMLNGGLPQGSPLSPWLTNQLMLPIDYAINKFCHDHQVTYTRYADDMLFSANSKTFLQNNVITEIQNILADTPLELNTEKTKISSIYGQNWNLGLMVNKDNKITVGTKKKERFRACLTEFAHNHEAWTVSQTQEFLGVWEYYKSVEPEYFANLLTKYNQKFNMDIRRTAINKLKA